MQNNSLVEIKLKANEFIEDYEKQITQRQYQKQKLKQNIMLEIMSNRHKSQASQSNDHDFSVIQSQDGKAKKPITVPVSEQRNLQRNKKAKQFNRSNSVPDALKDKVGSDPQQQQPVENESQRIDCAQITFKMSKNRNNYAFQNKEQKYQNQDEAQNEPQQLDNYLDQNQTLRQPKSKSNKTIQSLQQLNKKINNKSKVEKEWAAQKSSYKFKPKEPQVLPESSDNSPQNSKLAEDNYPQESNNAPIFLTLQENQSMDISEQNKNKNIAFDIVMDKSEPIQDIQQLRKKKIEEMEKKRQLRMEEFKKQQEVRKKSIQQKDIKRSSSILRGSKKIIQDPEPQPPKSKSRKKIEVDKQSKVNLSSQNIVQQSHYNMRPPQQPQRASYYNQVEKDSFIQQTPKTINSEYRVDKSKGKNTIFRQSPKRLDKSSSKYSQQPKIQPKERKNTFIKQSNKKLMITALTNVCLPGELNRKQRQKLTQVLQKQQAEFFVFLFKEYSRKVIKAIYVLDSSQSFLQKIYGQKAPQQIFSQNVQSFYRFDSGSRQFKKLDGCKSFSLVVHAIDLA